MTCEANVPWDKNNGIPSSVPIMTLTITDIHHASFKHWWMASFSTDGTRTNPFSTPKEQVCLPQRRKHPLSLPQSPPQYNLLGAATGIISRTLSTQHFVVDIAFCTHSTHYGHHALGSPWLLHKIVHSDVAITRHYDELSVGMEDCTTPITAVVVTIIINK